MEYENTHTKALQPSNASAFEGNPIASPRSEPQPPRIAIEKLAPDIRLTATHIWRRIVQNGFAAIAKPLPQRAWQDLYTAFDRFSESISGNSEAIASFNREAKQWQIESGLGPFFSGYFSPYYRDTSGDPGKDQKRIIQFCEPYYRYLYNEGSPFLANEDYRRLIDGLSAALHSCHAVVQDLLAPLEDLNSALYRALLPAHTLPPLAIRLLRYSADSVLSTNPHVDKSAITVILDTDDDPADQKLVFAKPRTPGQSLKLSEFRPFPNSRDQSVMFLGAALDEAGYSGFSALPHAVREFSRSDVRHSAIFFWLLPFAHMASFDTKVLFEDDLGVARHMARKK